MAKLILTDEYQVIHSINEEDIGADIIVSETFWLDYNGTITRERNATALSVGDTVILTEGLKSQYYLEAFDLTGNSLGTIGWPVQLGIPLLYGLARLVSCEVTGERKEIYVNDRALKIDLAFPEKVLEIYQPTYNLITQRQPFCGYWHCESKEIENHPNQYQINADGQQLILSITDSLSAPITNNGHINSIVMPSQSTQSGALSSAYTSPILINNNQIISGKMETVARFIDNSNYAIGTILGDTIQAIFAFRNDQDNYCCGGSSIVPEILIIDKNSKALEDLPCDCENLTDIYIHPTIRKIRTSIFDDCKRKQLKIHGVKNSQAHLAAQKMKVEFIEMTEIEMDEFFVEFLVNNQLASESEIGDRRDAVERLRQKQKDNLTNLETAKRGDTTYYEDSRKGAGFLVKVRFNEKEMYQYNCRYKYPEVGDLVLVTGKKYWERGVIEEIVPGLKQGYYMEEVDTLYKPLTDKFNQDKNYKEFSKIVSYTYYHAQQFEEKWDKEMPKKVKLALTGLVLSQTLSEKQKDEYIATIQCGFLENSIWNSYCVDDTIALHLIDYISTLIREKAILYREVERLISYAEKCEFLDIAKMLIDYKKELEDSNQTDTITCIEDLKFSPDTLFNFIEG